jgi:hypothetical protein
MPAGRSLTRGWRRSTAASTVGLLADDIGGGKLRVLYQSDVLPVRVRGGHDFVFFHVGGGIFGGRLCAAAEEARP